MLVCAPFQVQSGVRRGYALSGMLHSSAIESLLHKFRADLQGLSIPGCNVPLKLSAYADDVVIPVDSQQDVDVLVRDVVQFSSISSAKVNWDKSEAVSVGGVENKLSVSGGLIWKTGAEILRSVFR